MFLDSGGVFVFMLCSEYALHDVLLLSVEFLLYVFGTGFPAWLPICFFFNFTHFQFMIVSTIEEGMLLLRIENRDLILIG